MNAKLVGYWAVTGLFSAGMLMGGIFNLIGGDEVKKAMEEIGFPLYFARILGFWKVAGVLALLAPRLGLLKEWAYAGFVFNLTGAAASHFFAGHTIGEMMAPFILLALLVASWFLRPESRKLPGLTWR